MPESDAPVRDGTGGAGAPAGEPEEVPMSTHLQELRECPKRVDHRPVLVAHQVTLPMCQSRQRGHYHKCSTCVFQNAAERPAAPAPARRLAVGPPPRAHLVVT